ncbi:MAG TPA: hypothetical protein V6C71_00280 [Coleofasciculaceae cyanobacterium]|jgi:hypothetical protein
MKSLAIITLAQGFSKQDVFKLSNLQPMHSLQQCAQAFIHKTIEE